MNWNKDQQLSNPYFTTHKHFFVCELPPLLERVVCHMLTHCVRSVPMLCPNSKEFYVPGWSADVRAWMLSNNGNDGHLGATVQGVKMLQWYSSNNCAWISELSVLLLFQRYKGIKKYFWKLGIDHEQSLNVMLIKDLMIKILVK